jgi:two-component system NtrC family response regulator
MKAEKPRIEAHGRASILIIDDDKGMSYTLSRMVQETGHSAQTAFTIDEGMAVAQARDFDVVFLDVKLPDGNGLDMIPHIQALPFPPEIIIITAFGEKNGASKALKSGVWDYIEKPARIDTMKLSLLRALEYRNQKKALNMPLSIERSGIIGNSPKLLMCITLMAHAAKSEANVLLRGETGTGKELFARAIHKNSNRSQKPFIVVDCGSLPGDLAESILFGHVKGAFTGADKSHEGLVKQADSGTLFLDEVGDLPLDIQKKFLRVLQERRYRPVGSENEVESNFRLVSATNRDLESESESGRFRKDLLYRLITFVIELPPLRERIRDIKEITNYYNDKLCKGYGWKSKEISNEFFQLLYTHEWPGNVRELLSTLERALAMEPFCPTLYPKHLPENIRTGILDISAGKQETVSGDEHHAFRSPRDMPPWKAHRQQAIRQVEERYLKDLVQYTAGDIAAACKISGLKRARLYQLLKQYDVEKNVDGKE